MNHFELVDFAKDEQGRPDRLLIIQACAYMLGRALRTIDAVGVEVEAGIPSVIVFLQDTARTAPSSLWSSKGAFPELFKVVSDARWRLGETTIETAVLGDLYEMTKHALQLSAGWADNQDYDFLDYFSRCLYLATEIDMFVYGVRRRDSADAARFDIELHMTWLKKNEGYQ